MIVSMRKVFIVARSGDRETLLDTVRDLGVLHLVPVDPTRAAAEESVRRQVETVEQAMQTLSGIAPRQPAPALSSLEAADEVARIQRQAAEGRNRLVTLYHQLEQIEIWGAMRLEHVEELRRSGIDVRFFAVPPKAVDSIRAECVQVVGSLPNRQAVVAVVDREGAATLPDEAVSLPLPPRDAPSIRAEAKKLDESLHRDIERLHELAGLLPAMRAELVRLKQQVDDAVALRGAASDDALFGLQGWIPAETAAALDGRLAERNIPVVTRLMEPLPGELPPTLVRPPKWAKPIESLFNMLGTVPGYREFDVSIPFLIALPLFTAMLISDGGYGALLLAVPLLAYRR
ncbi:MAG TPA: hypothetical protein DD670_05450, partial [Planctomycetaceae bacterium]|nr:hypothetical protein [Planctomycetaceae bacterium]